MDEDDIQQDNALEIGVVNPEAVIINDDDGGVVIDFRPSSEEESVPFDANLAEYMDEGELSLLSSDLIAAYDEDRASRGEWEDAYIEGLDLLGVKIEDRTTPFEGATGVTHPILSEAVIRFVSQAMMEIFPSNGPVRTTVIGKKTLERDEQARRVQDYMNYLLTEEIEEYRPSTEQLLFKTALAGSGFRKVYYDRQHNRPDSIFVPAEDFVVSYDTTDIKSSPRYTHVMRKSDNFVRRMQLNGFYRDIEIGSSSDEGTDIQTKYNELTGVTEVSESDVRTLLEMHVELDLPGFEHTGDDGEPTGLNMPYVVTIDHSSDTILSIRRNYQEADPLAEPFQHFVHYKFQPGLGFYLSLIHI